MTTTRVRDRMRDATRTAVEDAAIELFYRNGFHGTSVRQVAEEAGVTASTIYVHFADKQALLRMVMERTMERLHEAVVEAVDATDPPAQRLRAAMAAHVTFHATHAREVIIADSELRALSAEGAEATIRLRDEYESLIRAIVEDGIATGDFVGLDAGVVTRSVVALCTSVAAWFRPTGAFDLSAIADTQARLILDGLTATDKGTATRRAGAAAARGPR